MEKHFCCQCENYRSYYSKGRDQFFVAYAGRCFPQEKTVDAEDTCEHWKEKKRKEKTVRKQEVYRAIVRGVKLLEELKQIIDEEDP
ncbi:MAG: hypothetical protein IJX96_00160 [Clostridia bacterium]|nr:hypothetical protein [Clostridia bacterium]